MLHVDLRLAETALADAAPYKEVLPWIRKARSAWSISLDLKEAYESLAVWSEVVGGGVRRAGESPWDSDPRVRITASALLKNAMIAYFRALDGNPMNGRSQGPLLDALSSPELKAAHGRIVSQRHTSIAHYGREEDADFLWANDTIVLNVADDGSANILTPHFRWVGLPDAAADLKAVVPVVHAASLKWFAGCVKKVQAKLARLGRAGELAPLLALEWTPETFFNTDALVADYLDRATNRTDVPFFQLVPKA